ncbi:MAG TPA: tetratricopeptide repeat protein [Blastocatellia bacterium]|nr:tetratricopeptide repeat protein [Blastocatellia bacterium]
MRRRSYAALVILLSIGSIVGATLVAQRAARKAKAPARSSQARRKPRAPAAPSGAVRPADPNRARQNLVDDALYTNEEFFGTQASVARPYSVALERIVGLIAKYPKDARLRLHAARLSEKLAQFDKAATEMSAYADLRGRSPDALRRLAGFYHNRARFADEVRTLQELANALNVNDRGPIYKRAAELVRSRSLTEFKPADFFLALVSADPENIQPIKNYVEELGLAKQNAEALAVLASYQPKFPSELGYFLKTRSQILETGGDRRAAEGVYSSAFDPNWPREIAADYYDLLRRFGRYRVVRRALQERVRAGATDFDTIGRLFSVFSYEGGFEQAARLLSDFENRRAGKRSGQAPAPQAPAAQPGVTAASSWPSRELEAVAEMFASIGRYDQASRYLYTLYLVGGIDPGTESREEALYRLFKVLLEAAGTPTRVGGGDLSFYRDVAEVDQHPGFMNGVLSLILSGTSPSQEFATEERAAAGYFNRSFAYHIFTSFKQEYAESKRLPEMYLGVVNVFASLGEHKLAIEAGREFQKRYPGSQNYADVSLRMADSYVALKDRVGERSVLAELLDRLSRNRPKGLPLVPVSPKHWSYGITPRVENLIDKIRYNIEAYSDTYDPTEDKAANDESEDREADSEVTDIDSSAVESEARRGPTYSSVLERYVASLAADEKKTETVAFFWGEIKKHPKEEGLYERFMRWLGQAQLINEQLKAYNSAIKQFDSNTWYHRLARWYVRQKRGKELTRYSRQLIGAFDEDEITEYLVRFAGFGAAAGGDDLNWDERFAYDLYSYAHTRFPRNLFFVRGMLTYLEKKDRPLWEKLSAEYYFADRSIREPYLAWLSKQNTLRDRYIKARANAGAADQSRRGAEAPSTYKIFAADTAMWLSHHDEALDAYRQLVAIYPGEVQYADRLADLTRSFGQQSDKLYEESASLFARMAEIYPEDHEYRIKAGEVYAQLGDFKRAGEQWDKLIALEPGERNTYLEVATVYWDYYQFDQAVRVFKDLRNTTGDQTIYAYRLGAVYEGKGDMDSAIAEYVKVLSEPGDGRDTVAKRLAQLSKRTGLADKIAAAYDRAHAADPRNWQLIIGYADYQAERDHVADALAMLRTEIEKSSEIAFLESVRDLYRAILRPEDEQQVIARLSAVARDEREAMMYRLQLASFLERHGQVDSAISLIDKLVGEYPTNVGVVEESALFYWRAGLLDKSLDLYKRTLARAMGANRRSFALLLARRQFDANKLADAESTLRAFYNENRSDTEVFGALARTLGAENKLNELATLYQDAFKEAREAGLGGEETGSRIAQLRVGMIRTLDALGKYEEAVDQHIEIINRSPEDAGLLATAIEYAERHNLMSRLVVYYEKLSKESNKNYRWQLVLGRIYERQGNLAGAIEQYRIAVVNEPQRSDFRFTLASVLARQRRYDEAVTVLRQGWTLGGRDPQWLIEVARIQVQQGERDEAVKTIQQALASRKNATIDAQFNIAAQLASWGLSEESARVYAQTFAAVPKKIESDDSEYIPATSVAAYVKVLLRSEAASSAYQKLEALRSQFAAIAQNSKDYRARSLTDAIDNAMRTDFGKGVIDYSSADETTALASAIRASISKLKLYSDAGELRRYLGIAHGAALADAEEQIQTQLKDAAFEARPKNSQSITPQDSAYYGELRALVSFYERHAAYNRAAEVLAAEFRRDPYKNRFDYLNQIAIEYRLSGNRDREIEWLRAAYAAASGSLTTNYTDWVDRYLSLLYSAGMRGEIQRLASTYSAYQLQLINFLVDKNEKLLALDAIDNAKQSTAWVKERSGEVGFFLKDTSPETEPYFKEALALQPIGQMLGRRLDPQQVLVGADWFVASRNYGYWLGLVGRELDSRRFVIGEIEGHPSSAAAQLELAAYYLDKKNPARAGDHVALASELAPGDRDVAIVRGAVALASRDRKGAMDAWGAIVSGRVTIADAQAYLKVMADNGFLIDSLPKLDSFLVSFVNRAVREKNASDRVEAIKPLVREIANRASADPKTASEVATFFHNVINSIPGDLTIGRMLIEETLLPEDTLASIYRTVHQRLSDLASAVFGTPEYENGYYSGGQYVYPARELADFRKLLIDYLIRTRSYEEARLLIRTIQREQADEKLALSDPDEDASTYADRYDWVPLASALIELRGNRDATKALVELRRYCGLEKPEVSGQMSEVGEDQSINLQDRCLKAYALLVAEHRESDADTLLYEAYTKAVRSGYSDDASLAGLAEIEARRGRGEEASRLLKRLVERSTDNLRGLQLAAETAARINRFADAIDYRGQIARINPEDAPNKLELARLISAAGRAGEAADQVVSLIGERSTSNTVRAQAAEVLGTLVRTDRSIAPRVLSALSQQARTDAGAVGRAAISEALGNSDEARAALATVTAGPLAAVAQWKLGLIALAGNRVAEATTSFERALYLDADGALTNSLNFRASGPRAQLIALYAGSGRDPAAIRLAEGEEQGPGSLISPAVRRALVSGSAATEAQSTMSFEPSLLIARSRATGLKTLAEMNESAASSIRNQLLASLVESAARLEQFDRAMAMARLRAAESSKPEDKAAIEKRVAEILTARQTRQQRLASLTRIDRSNAAASIYVAGILGHNR